MVQTELWLLKALVLRQIFSLLACLLGGLQGRRRGGHPVGQLWGQVLFM